MTHTPRRDGWSPALQRNFLELLAEGGVVRAAAAACGMSARAAYALRLSPRGAAFRIGWDAALLVARARLADALMERAIEGQADIVTREGDVATRHRHDNRLGLAMLARLDRLAECDQPAGSDAALARIVAQDFAAFLDLVDPAPALPAPLATDTIAADPASAGPAAPDAPAAAAALADEAGPGPAALALFLAVRQPLTPCELRPETGLDEADDDDLAQADPPPPSADEALGRLQGVWREDGIWRTDFPPPPGYDGDEEGEYGDPGYSRDLTPREAAAQDALHAAALAPAIAATAAARDAHFGFRPPRRPRDRAASSRRALPAFDPAVLPRKETPNEAVARFIAEWEAKAADQPADPAAAPAIVPPPEPPAPPALAPAPEPITYPGTSDVQTFFPVHPDPGPVRRHPLCARAPWYAY